MDKMDLEIQEFEEKETQGGKKYLRFKTDKGWMSCFDTKVGEELKKLKGKTANCSISQKGDFKNIRGFHGEPNGEEVPVEKVGSTSKNGKKEMYISYAKDCFCAIVTRISQSKFDDMEEEEILKLMDIAVKAVSKASDAF